MKLKKLLALLLTLCMLLTLFAACTSEEEPAPGNSDAGNVDPDGGDDGDDEDEIIELNYWALAWNDFNTDGEQCKNVEAAINAITEKELGIHLNFTWLGFADYQTQITLALSNNEQIDLAHYYFLMRSPAIYANGSAMDITELMNEYAPETLEELGWYIDLATFDGKIYGVPTYRQYNQNTYAIFRADNLNACGMYDKAKNMSTWTEFEEVVAAVTANCGTYGLGNSGSGSTIWTGLDVLGGENFSDCYRRENLGDSNLNMITVDANGKVGSIFDDELTTLGYQKITDWYNKGYIYPDTAFSVDNNKTQLGMNTYGAMIQVSEYGVESSYSNSVGTECLCVNLWPLTNDASGAAGLGAFVPTTCGNPEAAVKLINLIWNNAELANLMAWGIEGVNYEVVDGVAKYPDGVDASNNGYRQADYLFGNQFLCLPWEGSPANFRELALADMEAAPASDYAGFSVDVSSLDAVVSALTAVKDEYLVTMGAGMYTDEMWQECVAKAKAAGIDEYVALFQTQLDDFMA